MIHRTFEEPKFSYRCEFLDGHDRRHSLLLEAESEEDLKAKIEEQNYRVSKITKYDSSQWKEKAKNETEKNIEAHKKGQSIKFKSTIWSEIKSCLFRLFHGKCAYCESKVLHVASGDVEHYRPKGKVEEDLTHPGYYWLAYDCSNLLPSCEKCNRALAKMNHFPVAGFRAFKPEDISREKPLLLNPFIDNPSEHLIFPAQTNDLFVGTVKGITKKGKESIKYYHLDRSTLDEMRRDEQQRVIQDLEYYLGKDLNKISKIVYEIREGIRPYSGAALAQAQVWKKALDQRLAALKVP